MQTDINFEHIHNLESDYQCTSSFVLVYCCNGRNKCFTLIKQRTLILALKGAPWNRVSLTVSPQLTSPDSSPRSEHSTQTTAVLVSPVVYIPQTVN